MLLQWMKQTSNMSLFPDGNPFVSLGFSASF